MSLLTNKSAYLKILIKLGKFNVRNNPSNTQETKEMMETLLNDWSNGANMNNTQDGEEETEDQQTEGVLS